MTVETTATPHDGVDGVVFVVDDGRHRLGILTDLGHVFDDLEEIIGSLDAVLLESNYDPICSPTAPIRIGFRNESWAWRHISNFEAADLLSGTRRLRWACLAHLSHDNNTPALALRTQGFLQADADSCGDSV